MSEKEEDINPIDDWKMVYESLGEQINFKDEDFKDNLIDLLRYHSEILYVVVKWIIDISSDGTLMDDVKKKITAMFTGENEETPKKDGKNPLVV